MKPFFKLLFISFLVFSTSGCAAVLIGAGVVGGMAVTEDTVQSYVDKNFNSLWKTSLDVLGKLGEVSGKNKDTGTIKAIVENSNIEVVLEETSDKSTSLKVSARKVKKVLPDIKLATKVHNRIIEEAKKSWF